MSSAAVSSATVRISLDTRDRIRDLSSHIGKTMQAVVEEAIDLYRRHCFLEEVNASYADLREDAQAWSEIAEERAKWDATLLDDGHAEPSVELGGRRRDRGRIARGGDPPSS